MQIFRYMLAVFFLMGILMAISHADSVIFKSGKEIKGEIIQETDQLVIINFEGVDITFYKDEIDKMLKDSLGRAGDASLKKIEDRVVFSEADLQERYKAVSNDDLYKQVVDIVDQHTYVQPGNLDEAKGILELLIQRDIHFLKGYCKLVSVMRRLACSERASCDPLMLKQAHDLIDKARSIDPNSPKVLLTEANLAMRENNMERVLQIYNELQERNPNAVDNVFLGIDIAVREGRSQDALDLGESLLNQALTKTERYELYVSLADVYRQTARVDKEKEMLLELVKLWPESIRAKDKYSSFLERNKQE